MFEIRTTFTKTPENGAVYPSTEEEEAIAHLRGKRNELVDSESGWKLVSEMEGLFAALYNAERAEWAFITLSSV